MQLSNMWNVAKCEIEPLHSKLTYLKKTLIFFDMVVNIMKIVSTLFQFVYIVCGKSY